MTEASYIIREATVNDAIALIDFFVKIAQQTDYVELDIIDNNAQRHLIEMYHQHPYSLFLVCEYESKLIAMANLATIDRNGSEVGVCVLSDYWGHGIGTELMLSLHDFAENVGLHRLYLDVKRSNHRAIQLYEQLGYVKVQSESNEKMLRFEYIVEK